MKVTQLCPTLCDPMDYTVHGILQARILGKVAFPFSRASSQPKDWTQVSHLAVDSLPAEPQEKPKDIGFSFMYKKAKQAENNNKSSFQVFSYAEHQFYYFRFISWKDRKALQVCTLSSILCHMYSLYSFYWHKRVKEISQSEKILSRTTLGFLTILLFKGVQQMA